MANETVIHGRHYASGEAIRVALDGGVIRSVEPFRTTESLPTVAPGLVDLQINGHGGFDFNRVPMGEETLAKAVRLLWREGVTSFCPTVITNEVAVIERGMREIAAACERDGEVGRAVAGVHLEGPFISAEDGPRGAHERRFVRAPDFELFQRWQEAAGGRIRIVTMSPEWPGAAAFIGRCAAEGVVVSIGHTAATPEQVRDAVAAGARMSTHLGNGCHLTLPRHPNYLWEQLAADDLWTSVIADGFHLPDAVLKVILRVKGGRAVLVSDAVALCGLPPGEYVAGVGGRVVLTEEGRLHLAGNEKLLAGSAQPLIHGVGHLIRRGLATLGEAWDRGSVGPARLLGLPQAAGLAAGARADLAVVEEGGGRLRVMETYVAGRKVRVDSDGSGPI